MFGLFEMTSPALGNRRVFADLAFADASAAVAHFGDKVLSAEIEADGFAVMILKTAGMPIYTVEAL